MIVGKHGQRGGHAADPTSIMYNVQTRWRGDIPGVHAAGERRAEGIKSRTLQVATMLCCFWNATEA